MMGMIEKIREPLGIKLRLGERQPHEFCIWADLVDSSHNGVVSLGVKLWSGLVFEVHLIQHLPDRKAVAVSGLVLLAVFIGEAAPRIPAHQARIVITQFLA